MAYADYAFYIGEYQGDAIALADFSRLAARASAEIDRLTFGRTAAVVTAGTDTATIRKIKMATCAAAEEIHKLEESGGVVTSERIGNVAITYADGRNENQRLAAAAKTYLWDTDLMQRGFLEDEL